MRYVTRIASFCLAVATAPAIAAQSCYHLPSNTPTTGTPGLRPFGNADPADPVFSDLRYQVQIPASVFGNQALDICEVYAAPAGNRQRQFTEFDVRFGHNPTTLGARMVFNMVGFTAILVGTDDIKRDTVADQWWPLGMTAPFRYDPAFGELVLEFRVRNGGAPTGTGDPGFRTDPSIPYVHARGGSYNGTIEPGGGIKLQFCTDAHGLITYGSGGCTGSNGQQPRLDLTGNARIGGPGFQVALTNAVIAPNTPTALFWGFRVRSGPFDLAGIGAPGCAFFVFPDVVTPVFTSNGTATVSVPVGATLTPCTRVWAQWLLLDVGANNLGVVSSNFGAVLAGN